MLSYRKLAMRVLGRPLHTGGNDSPRPASQRAAAFILTAAMLTTLAAPAFAKTWHIEDGDITVKAGDTKGTNKVSQGESTDVPDTDTVITNREKNASSHTVTIETNDKNDKVEVTLKDVNIDTSSRKGSRRKRDRRGRHQYQAGWRQRAEERHLPQRHLRQRQRHHLWR